MYVQVEINPQYIFYIILVELGTDINKICRESGWTPISNVYLNGNEVIVKYLVELGANINKLNNDYTIPLNIAYKNENKAVVKYLVECGVEYPTVKKKKENNYINIY